jgi:hypothetical protein
MGRSPHARRAPSNATTGKMYEAHIYVVGRAKVREYAAAIGETHSIHHDREGANAADFADVVAAPVFAVVFGSGPMMHAIFHPEAGIDSPASGHGGKAIIRTAEAEIVRS